MLVLVLKPQAYTAPLGPQGFRVLALLGLVGFAFLVPFLLPPVGRDMPVLLLLCWVIGSLLVVTGS